jgi:hypothetical protein
LIQQGLDGSLCMIRVAGEPGMGRRRLIAEALNRGPDAEWIHLAPGGVEADFPRWVNTELIDLLDTYPEVPQPSWALHALARWAPSLRRRAAVPARSRERIPNACLPEVLGSAVAAILVALTGRTLVVVDAGLWPVIGSAKDRMLWAMAHALSSAGTVMIAASGLNDDLEPSWEGVRTLDLDPLRLEDIREMVSVWTGTKDPDALAVWFRRVTGGRPFFLHEVVRWLEELGHVRVDEDRKRIEFLDPVDCLPIPLYLPSVMDARYRRLAPGSARLLHLLSQHDGTLEIETLRRLSDDEGEAFEEALAVLRRREFLLRRTSRRPLALANPLWKRTVDEGIAQFSRNANRGPSTNGESHSPPGSPLAKTLLRLSALHRMIGGKERTGDVREGLARTRHFVRGRLGPSWDGVRGRLAVLAARLRLSENRGETALRWIGWGMSRLDPNRQPGLRRSLYEAEAMASEQLGRSEHADRVRETALAEAFGAGHLNTAARLRAVLAESRRRAGKLTEAEAEARTAEAQLRTMGFSAMAGLAGYTMIAALIDARRLDEAGRELEERVGDEDEPPWTELVHRLEMLRRSPPLPILHASDSKIHPSGWGWGLDDHPLWIQSRKGLTRAVSIRRRDGLEPFARATREIAEPLESAGHWTARADLAEVCLWLTKDDDPETRDALLEDVLAHVERLGVSERRRFLAEVLRESPWSRLAAYKRTLAPLLLRSVRRATPEFSVLLFLMGRPRVEASGSTWPMALWPKWWQRLWLLVVTYDLLGEPTSRTRVESLLRELGDTPPGNLEFWCDVREFLSSVSQAQKLDWEGQIEEASLLRGDSLRMVSGPLLPGQDGDGVERLREVLVESVTQTVNRYLAGQGEPGPETRVMWLEGPGRMVDLASREIGRS